MSQYKGMEISDFWPHKFTPNGKEIQIGEEKFTDNMTRPVYAQPMICVHCHQTYVRGKGSQPQGKCPARQTKKEIKRIINS